MPGYTCSIRERMLYSSCKSPLLEIVERQLQMDVIRKVIIYLLIYVIYLINSYLMPTYLFKSFSVFARFVLLLHVVHDVL